jgi:hypothetical protein
MQNQDGNMGIISVCFSGVTQRILDELVAPMNELQIEEEEYVALKAITFFNPRSYNASFVHQIHALQMNTGS